MFFSDPEIQSEISSAEILRNFEMDFSFFGFFQLFDTNTSYCIVFMGLVNFLISDKSSCGKDPMVISLSTARLLKTCLESVLKVSQTFFFFLKKSEIRPC